MPAPDELIESLARRLAYHRLKFDSLTKEILETFSLADRNRIFDKVGENLTKMGEKIMKTAKKTLIIILVAIMAVAGLPGTLKAKSGVSGGDTPQKWQKVAHRSPFDAICVIKTAQNTENTDSGDIEAEIIDNCCTDLDECKAEIERLKKDPPEIPAKAWLMAFQWFRNMSPALQTLIGTTISALIVAGLTYLGTLAK